MPGHRGSPPSPNRHLHGRPKSNTLGRAPRPLSSIPSSRPRSSDRLPGSGSFPGRPHFNPSLPPGNPEGERLSSPTSTQELSPPGYVGQELEPAEKGSKKEMGRENERRRIVGTSRFSGLGSREMVGRGGGGRGEGVYRCGPMRDQVGVK